MVKIVHARYKTAANHIVGHVVPALFHTFSHTCYGRIGVRQSQKNRLT